MAKESIKFNIKGFGLGLFFLGVFSAYLFSYTTGFGLAVIVLICLYSFSKYKNFRSSSLLGFECWVLLWLIMALIGRFTSFHPLQYFKG
jgi:hypothetical protein